MSKFTLTANFDSLEELQKFNMAASLAVQLQTAGQISNALAGGSPLIQGDGPAAQPQPAPAPVEEKPKRAGRPPKAAAPAPKEEPAPEPEVEDNDTEQDAADELPAGQLPEVDVFDDEADEPEVTLDDVRKAGGEYQTKFGPPAAQADIKAILSKVGIGKFSELPNDPAVLRGVVQDIRDALANNPYKRKAVA
jgi:hypothetical protein